MWIGKRKRDTRLPPRAGAGRTLESCHELTQLDPSRPPNRARSGRRRRTPAARGLCRGMTRKVSTDQKIRGFESLRARHLSSTNMGLLHAPSDVDDDEHYSTDVSTNPCGHTDPYSAVVIEARGPEAGR
jgi:hypothetical protein